MYKACNSRNTKTKAVIKIDTLAGFRRTSSQNDWNEGFMGPGGGLTKYMRCTLRAVLMLQSSISFQFNLVLIPRRAQIYVCNVFSWYTVNIPFVISFLYIHLPPPPPLTESKHFQRGNVNFSSTPYYPLQSTPHAKLNRLQEHYLCRLFCQNNLKIRTSARKPDASKTPR